MDKSTRLPIAKRVRAARASGMSAWIVVAAVLLAPALVLGAWVAMGAVPDPTLTGRTAQPVVVPVTSALRQASTSLTIEVAQDEGATMLSASSGTVTVAPAAGNTYSNGDVVFEVGDNPVRAMVSDAPLWRPLTVGDRGEDVLRLERFLNSTGHFAGTPDDRYDWQTRVAVSAFALEAGAPRNTAVFDPAWVIWVGPSPFTVEQVDAPVGTAVEPGTVVATGPATATAITVTEPPGGLGVEYGEDAELVLFDIVAPYAIRSGKITDPAVVQQLVEALMPLTEGSATVRAAHGTEVSVVPASAIVTSASGAVCLYPDETSAPVIVTPVGGGGATVQIPFDANLTTVLANPNLVDGLTPCA